MGLIRSRKNQRKTYCFRWLILALQLALLAVPNAAAEQAAAIPSDWHPQLCSGYLSELQRWGSFSVGTDYGLDEFYCPGNHAFFSIDDPKGGSIEPAKVEMKGVCCPLPHIDILSQKHHFVMSVCPEHSVATGARLRPNRTVELRCTEIEQKRFQLAPAQPGQSWGFSAAALHFWNDQSPLLFAALPAGIRYGVARVRQGWLTTSGCIGNPIGSLLTGKQGRTCKEFLFSELQYTGQPGDPSAGTAVAMYPDCDFVLDIFSESPRCLVYRE